MLRIPWRLKAILARRFPLLYSYVVNLGSHPYNRLREGPGIADHWDLPSQIWPDVNTKLIRLSKPDDVVLDVGVGTATMLRFLQKSGYADLHAVDATRYTLRRLAERTTALTWLSRHRFSNTFLDARCFCGVSIAC